MSDPANEDFFAVFRSSSSSSSSSNIPRQYIPIYIQQDAHVTQFILSGNCSTCFGWYFHPPSGVQTTVSQHLVFVTPLLLICRYRG